MLTWYLCRNSESVPNFVCLFVSLFCFNLNRAMDTFDGKCVAMYRRTCRYSYCKFWNALKVSNHNAIHTFSRLFVKAFVKT